MGASFDGSTGGRDAAVAMGEPEVASASGRVRVLSPRGAVQGAGVLLTPGLVMTCAHVVASAVGTGAASDRFPPGPVRLDSAGSPGTGEATVLRDGWFPGPLAGGAGADLALLHAEWSPPDHVLPARLARCGEADGRTVQVYGHPSGAPDGIWSEARLVGRGGPHARWIQLEGPGSTGVWIGPGYSGAGVWDPGTQGVVGVVTAAYSDSRAKVAWMLPVEEAAQLWPPLVPLLDPPQPAPGRPVPMAVVEPPSDRNQFALADALLAVPQIAEDGAATLRRLLPPRIRHSIPDQRRPRLRVFYLVQACADHADGRSHLLDALTAIDDSSEPAKAAFRLFDALWPTSPGPPGGPDAADRRRPAGGETR